MKPAAPSETAAAPRRVLLLGATGSIGENTLAVLRANPGRLRLVGVAAHSRAEPLAAIAREFDVAHVGIAEAARAGDVARLLPEGTTLHVGPEGIERMASEVQADIVLVAVVGTGGLRPTLAAIRAGRDIALASKEILVLAGPFVMEEARRAGVRVLPVDSEHNAIFQCLEGNDTREVARLLLTASGGALRDRPLDQLGSVTPAEALRHPTWAMGPKVTIDSATMANKGLEMIEARWLFDVEPSRIEVVIHPQSIVHSMVEFVDGSILAQLSPPSMTFAIQHALLYPKRHDGTAATLDFRKALRLDFAPPDPARYPCLALARAALETGGAAPGVFNAANEEAVAAFVAGLLPYSAIAEVIEHALVRHGSDHGCTLEAVLAADAAARATARARIRSR